jgi:type VI secretion system secreted protein Hcp
MFIKKGIMKSSLLLLSLLAAIVPLAAGCTPLGNKDGSPGKTEAAVSSQENMAQFMAGDVQVIFPADYRIFLSLDTVPGDSIEHTDYTDILSFEWGMSQSAVASAPRGIGSGRAEVLELSLTHMQDIASPYLMYRCARGDRLMDATLELWTIAETPQKFYELRLDDVIISRVGISSSSELNEMPLSRPYEEFGLTFARVTWTYWPQNEDGSMGSPKSAMFDIEANKIYWIS